MKLDAPESYWNLNPAIKKIICNGCGTKGLGGILVPDTLYGLSIEEPCNIHDYMYSIGKTIKDKKQADLTFLANMLTVIDSVHYPIWKKPLKALRIMRAVKYFEAVVLMGNKAFFKNKYI